MSYTRHDKDNNIVDPQPSSISVTIFDGDEGWSEITYDRWNGNYVARKSDNTSRTPGTYQKRDINNNVVVPSTYQRHDIDNNPILK
jgi:hypothetical protein